MRQGSQVSPLPSTLILTVADSGHMHSLLKFKTKKLASPQNGRATRTFTESWLLIYQYWRHILLLERVVYEESSIFAA